MTKGRLFFTLLSIVYVAGIFLWADSPVVSVLAPFNPYSLLHIPLYGILTVLLIFSFSPFNLKTNGPNGPNVLNALNLPCEMQSLFHRGEPNVHNTSTRVRFLISGFIALIVAVADEIHQSFIPTRDASVIDIFLDAVGIVLVIYLILWFYKIKKRAFNFEP
jgi:hypothetical protein